MTINLEQFAEELRELCAEEPDRMNPLLLEGDGCAYRREEEDGTVTRCLIGEWLHRKGHETKPHHEGHTAPGVIKDMLPDDDFEPGVLTLARAVQTFLDGSGKPQRWIEAKGEIDRCLVRLDSWRPDFRDIPGITEIEPMAVQVELTTGVSLLKLL